MSEDDFTAAERFIAGIVIYPDPDEPMSYEDGVQIGCNAHRVLTALRKADFVIFRARRKRQACEG